MQYQKLNLTLLDTPGHADFGAQTEQVLSVLDYAILVVSATDGVQGYTRTLWRLLAQYQIPTFIFVNKMDAPGVDRDEMLTQLQAELAPGCLAFDGEQIADSYEDIALQDDVALDSYMASETLSDDVIRRLISQRKVFPTYFGAALKLTGVEALMAGLERWTIEPTLKESSVPGFLRFLTTKRVSGSLGFALLAVSCTPVMKFYPTKRSISYGNIMVLNIR